jgi:hypothetical protein
MLAYLTNTAPLSALVGSLLLLENLEQNLMVVLLIPLAAEPRQQCPT